MGDGQGAFVGAAGTKTDELFFCQAVYLSHLPQERGTVG